MSSDDVRFDVLNDVPHIVVGDVRTGRQTHTHLEEFFRHTIHVGLTNRGLFDGVFFYRDSNQNEVDILLKEEGEITAIEVKSSMTYHSSFADSITKLSDWIKTPVVKKIIVYTGDFENTASDVKLINYKNFLL